VGPIVIKKNKISPNTSLASTLEPPLRTYHVSHNNASQLAEPGASSLRRVAVVVWGSREVETQRRLGMCVVEASLWWGSCGSGVGVPHRAHVLHNGQCGVYCVRGRRLQQWQGGGGATRLAAEYGRLVQHSWIHPMRYNIGRQRRWHPWSTGSRAAASCEGKQRGEVNSRRRFGCLINIFGGVASLLSISMAI
jgi:hypothetical protein